MGSPCGRVKPTRVERQSSSRPYAESAQILRSNWKSLGCFGAKIEIAAREKATDFELVMVPFDPARGYDPKHPDVLRINPKRQVPVRSWTAQGATR
jgi:hypothetical protein